MIYRLINSLLRSGRYRAQRLWMHTRNLRVLLWRQSPGLLFQVAFVVPLVGLLLLWALVRLAPLLAGLLLA
ncbi:MAG: hypothetical protein WBG32_00905 [Nodosilinea sp.]